MRIAIHDSDHLQLVNATAEMLRAELDGSQHLDPLLDAVVPAAWPPELFDRDDMQRYLGYAEAGHERWGLWYIVRDGGDGARDQLLGVVGFAGPPSPTGDVTIGYSLMPDARGRGYATRAARALIEDAFRSPAVRRVLAETFPDLLKSVGVLERLGFHRDPLPGPRGTIRFVLSRDRQQSVSSG